MEAYSFSRNQPKDVQFLKLNPMPSNVPEYPSKEGFKYTPLSKILKPSQGVENFSQYQFDNLGGYEETDANSGKCKYTSNLSGWVGVL